LPCEAKKRQNFDRVPYWEIIADNLKKRGWSYGYVSAVDSKGQTIWIADAHRDGKRFVVRAEEKLTAFIELEAAIHRQPGIVTKADRAGPPMPNSARRYCTSPRRGRLVE
jgi:hypothetical protein